MSRRWRRLWHFPFLLEAALAEAAPTCLHWDQRTNLAGKQPKGKSGSFSRLLPIMRKEQVVTVPVKQSIAQSGSLSLLPKPVQVLLPSPPSHISGQLWKSRTSSYLLRRLTFSCSWESINGPLAQDWSSTPTHSVSETVFAHASPLHRQENVDTP